MPALTFVTTRRGRLPHLQQSLATFVVPADSTCVVVDYDCPERSGDWVRASFPEVEVVFDLARPGTIENWGTVICAREDFERVGGYDEVLQGWGKDDDDFYARLVLAGASHATFPGELLRAIPHDDGQRVQSYDVKDRWLNESINHVYCRAKLDLLLLKRAPPSLEAREKLYAHVREAVLGARRSGGPLQITIPVMTQETRACGPLEARLLYTLPTPRGEGSPRANAGSLIPRPTGS